MLLLDALAIASEASYELRVLPPTAQDTNCSSTPYWRSTPTHRQHNWTDYQREARHSSTAKLKYTLHEHDSELELGQLRVPEDGEPDGEHQRGGGCLVCPAARAAARKAAAAGGAS